MFLQGLLLLAILGGGTSTTDTFAPDEKETRIKTYLVFILAYTTITNIVVRF